jgi:predicted dehydrogenase
VCEKPLTDSLAGVDEMARAEAASGRRLMPVFQYRFGAGLQKVKRLVDAGLAGAPLAASVEVHWRRRADYYAVPWRGKFATELGGVLTTHAIHAVDMLTYVFGPVRSVFARTSTRSNPIEVEDCAAVVFEHVNGALSTLSCTLGSAAESTRHRLVFANLTAESNTRAYTNSLDPWTYTPDRPEVAEGIEKLIADYDATAAEEAQRASGVGSGGSLTGYTPPARYDAQLLRFYHALANNTPLPVDIGDARNAIELLSATYHSAQIGAPVSLPLDASHPVYTGWSPRNATGKSS